MMWRQLDLFVPEEPDMVALGVKFRQLLAEYETKQKIPPERPRLLAQREKALSARAPTKEQIEPLLRAGMSAGEIAKQSGVVPYVVTNALCRLWPEFRGSIKRIRESLGVTAPKPISFQPQTESHSSASSRYIIVVVARGPAALLRCSGPNRDSRRTGEDVNSFHPLLTSRMKTRLRTRFASRSIPRSQLSRVIDPHKRRTQDGRF